MTIEVFRTYKGNQEKGVKGTIWLGNPQTGKQVILRNFLAKKFATQVQMVPRSFITAGRDGKAETIDLFSDMVSDDGHLQITCNAWSRSNITAWPRLTCISAPPTVRLPGTSARATWASGC